VPTIRRFEISAESRSAAAPARSIRISIVINGTPPCYENLRHDELAARRVYDVHASFVEPLKIQGGTRFRRWPRRLRIVDDHVD
jgi:hypothetical protein